MRSSVGVIIELPEMYKLIDRAGIALEISDELFVLPALLERREADLLIELYRLGHLADTQRIGSEFVDRHSKYLRLVRRSLGPLIICDDSVFSEIYLVFRMVAGSASPLRASPQWARLGNRARQAILALSDLIRQPRLS